MVWRKAEVEEKVVVAGWGKGRGKGGWVAEGGRGIVCGGIPGAASPVAASICPVHPEERDFKEVKYEYLKASTYIIHRMTG